MGAMGGLPPCQFQLPVWVGEYTWERLVRRSIRESLLDYPCYETMMRLLWGLARLLARLLVISVIWARLLAILATTMLAFHRLFGLSWENILVIVEFYSQWLLVYMATCFFFRWCPPEELDNKRSSTRRGEFDSSTPEAIGVLSG